MKTIILIMILAMSANAENVRMCNFHTDRALKHSKKASIAKSKEMYKYYNSTVIESLIVAKYACPKSMRKDINKNIKNYKNLIKGL